MGRKTDVPVVTSTSKDPASVIYDGINTAEEKNNDVILVDTAGRLQNKTNLMQELNKINKVIKKLSTRCSSRNPTSNRTQLPGQNGISQAKSFKEITNITGNSINKVRRNR